MSKRKIEVYTQALSQLLLKSKQDFQTSVHLIIIKNNKYRVSEID